jgi:cell wall-associated NlpC family hydrolase
MEKLTENMIRWAESKLGSTEYAGWCLAFIEDALEISNDIEIFGGDSAKESSEMYKDALRDGVPERGAFVFYDCLCPSENGPVNWGHCGVSLGDGRVIHAWDMVRIDDYLAIEKLTALTGDHPEYLGWVALERVLNQKPRVYFHKSEFDGEVGEAVLKPGLDVLVGHGLHAGQLADVVEQLGQFVSVAVHGDEGFHLGEGDALLALALLFLLNGQVREVTAQFQNDVVFQGANLGSLLGKGSGDGQGVVQSVEVVTVSHGGHSFLVFRSFP